MMENGAHKNRIIDLLKLTIENKASDLHLIAGFSPALRVDGEIRPTVYPPLSPDDVKSLITSILTPEQREILRQRDQKHIEEVRKERSQLEKQKELPGFCDHCGRPDADYVVNPYYHEMNDEEHYEWLCPECYHEAAMDV